MSDPRMVNRWEQIPGYQQPATIAGLLDWAAEHGLDPEIVTITGGHLRWQTPETPEERERREEAERRSDERREAWERAAYRRFADKYGPLDEGDATDA